MHFGSIVIVLIMNLRIMFRDEYGYTDERYILHVEGSLGDGG